MRGEESLLGALAVTSSEKATERRKRKSEFDKKAILKDALDEALKDGWSLEKEQKRTFRVQRRKSDLEQLENRFWLLLDQLKFDQISASKNFFVRYKTDNSICDANISVLSKDDEVVIIAKCKSLEELSKISMREDVNAFDFEKGNVAKTVKKHFGSGFNPKIIWVYVTSNVVWAEAERQYAKERNINIITERELRYFSELARHLGAAGKYQFLAHFLEGQKIPGLQSMSVPAIRGKLGDNKFYAFVTTPEKLLKISFVNHRTLNDPKGAPSYQRLIDRKRLKTIQSYIEGGGFFPTNIIINFDTQRRFDIAEKSGSDDVRFGTLYLPEKFKSAWVIDGQHRLYGYADMDDDWKQQSIFVLAFEKLSREEEANLFVTINHEQKSVPKNLMQDLKGELHWGSDDPRQRLVAMSSRLVNQLNDDIGEPFSGRIVQAGLKGNKEVCLTLPQLVEGIRRAKLLGVFHTKLKNLHFGPFSGVDDFETLDRARHCLNDIFSAIRKSAPDVWASGLEGGVCTNISVCAIFLLIDEAFKCYEAETRNDCKELEAEDLAIVALDYLSPLLEKLNTLGDNDIRNLFKEGIPYGSTGPKELFLKLVGVIREKYPSFGPADFEVWESELNKERARDAGNKLQEMNEKVCSVLFGILRREYGEGFYWDKAISDKVMKTNAYNRSLDEDVETRGRIEEYLNFLDYRKIIERKENWALVKEIFDIPLPGEKGKSKNLIWFDKMNDIRKKTAHTSSNRQLSPDEIELVDYIYTQFNERVRENISLEEYAA